MNLRFLSSGIAVAVLLVALPAVAEAAQSDASLFFRPHCPEASAGSPCPTFLLRDPETLMTPSLAEGDSLRFDVVVRNPSGQPVQAVQAWIEYDPISLEVQEVRSGKDFPLAAPGELEADVRQGLIKIGVSNVSGGVRGTEAVVASVTLAVTRESPDAVLKFHDFAPLGQGHTRVHVVEGSMAVNILVERPKALALIFGEVPAPYQTPVPVVLPSPISPVPPPVPGGEPPPLVGTTPPPPGPPPSPSDFVRLQPQGVRVATQGSDLYAAWTALPDSRVAGYNLYYGTVSGRYVQRRTVGVQTTSVTIAGLPTGQRYYVAVTAFSQDMQESEFSYEAAVVIGDPQSSTAPFTASVGGNPLAGGQPGTGGSALPGETGLPTLVLLVLLVAAAIGSLLVVRRLRASAHA